MNRMRRCVLAFAVLVIVAGGLAAFVSMSSAAPDTELKRLSDGFAEVAAAVKPAVVNVSSTTVLKGMGGFHGSPHSNPFDPFRDFFGDDFFDRLFPRERSPRPYKRQGLGSGVIVDAKGYVLTNNHVVEGADEIEVKLGDKREFKAKVVGTDPKTDVAVLKIDAEGLPVAKLGDSDAIRVGELVVAIGNPFGLTQTVTAGIISFKGRANVGIADYEDFIQTDAAINPGNSGGPLVNLDSEVIGITSAIFSQSGGYQGVGFAVPVNMARNVMDALITTGKVTRGWLGVMVQDVTKEIADRFGLKETRGALVAEVSKNSPAEKSGLKEGDVITEFGGKKVEDVGHFRNAVAQTRIGETAKYKVIRDGKEMGLKAEIEEQPAGLFGEPTETEKDIGMTVQELTPELADRFGYAEGEGVIVAEVEPTSPAGESGIRTGDVIKEVNRKKVTNVQEYQEALSESREQGSVLLLIKRGRMSRYVLLRLS